MKSSLSRERRTFKRTFLFNHGNVWCPSISILHSTGIKKSFETRNFSWYRNPWTTLSRTLTINCPYKYEAAWCSTPTLLLICSSFSAENGYPFLFCASLSRAQIGYSLGRSRMNTCQTHQPHWHSIAMFGSKYVPSPFQSSSEQIKGLGMNERTPCNTQLMRWDKVLIKDAQLQIVWAWFRGWATGKCRLNQPNLLKIPTILPRVPHIGHDPWILHPGSSLV